MKRARFHGNRVFHADELQEGRGGWYFEVRGGTPRGPFATRELAERALAEYVGRRRDHPAAREDEEAHRQKTERRR